MAKKYYKIRKYRREDSSLKGRIAGIIRKYFMRAEYDSERMAEEILDLIKIKYQSI